MWKQIILPAVLGFIPSFFLYRFLYAFIHDSAILESCNRLDSIACTDTYTGNSLKIRGLSFLLGFVIFLYYNSFPKDTRSKKYMFSPKGISLVLNKSLLIWIIFSILYLPLFIYFGSIINPW